MAINCTLDQARAAKSRVLQVFERLVQVVGVGITRIDDSYGVKVNLAAKPPSFVKLPVDVDGVPVWVEVVGKIRKG
jgi:hypothetical protein